MRYQGKIEQQRCFPVFSIELEACLIADIEIKSDILAKVQEFVPTNINNAGNKSFKLTKNHMPNNTFKRIEQTNINFQNNAQNNIINPQLKNENHIYMRKTKQECKKKEIMDDTIYNDTIQLYGLKKYLNEFSNMKEKTAIEVHIWDEYLMFAYLFGIADQVAKQFKKLYPEVINEMNNYNLEYNSFIFINSLSRDVVSAAQSAANSYSAGGGGFSSGGGGDGSFGGGGGGGGFR